VWGVILAVLIASIAALNFIVNAMQGFFQNQNRAAAPDTLQSTANGMQVMSQNLIGFGLGAFLPGLITTAFSSIINWIWTDMNEEALASASWTFGMCSVFLSPWLLYYCTKRAVRCLPSDLDRHE